MGQEHVFEVIWDSSVLTFIKKKLKHVSCSIGDAVGINRHFKEKHTDSHFSIYLGGTRSAQAQQISVSMWLAETMQHSDSSQVNGL